METDAYLEERAEERVVARNGFYLHLAFYALVSLGLFGAVWFFQGDGWLFAPIVGWGMAVLLHGLMTFIGQTRRVEQWRRRRVQGEVEKLKRRSS